MTRALPSSPKQRWDDYLKAEANGAREEKLTALGRFLDDRAKADDAAWRSWAFELAARIVDGGETIPVRLPLFERVLFPALVAGLDEGRPGCARWLAGLTIYLNRCRSCLDRLGAGRTSERELLQLALGHDPDDRLAQRRLVDLIADRFDYSLHELPSGVLYDTDGATVPQCDALKAELDEFRALLDANGRTAEFADLVAECAFHYDAYKRYLLQRTPVDSYAAFLEEIGAGGRSGADRS